MELEPVHNQYEVHAKQIFCLEAIKIKFRKTKLIFFYVIGRNLMVNIRRQLCPINIGYET